MKFIKVFLLILIFFISGATLASATDGGDTVTVTVLPTTGSISASNCIISAGASTCNTTLNWNITNPQSSNSYVMKVSSPNTLVASVLGTSGSVAVAVNYTYSTFYLQNNAISVSGSTTTVYSSCANGSTWNNSICASNQEVLTITKGGNGGGTVTGAGTYNYGTVVTATATPDANSTFSGWGGGGCSGTGTCTVTMNSNTTITAYFAARSNITSLYVSPSTIPYGGTANIYYACSNGYYSHLITDENWNWQDSDYYNSRSPSTIPSSASVMTTPGSHYAMAYCYNSDWIPSYNSWLRTGTFDVLPPAPTSSSGSCAVNGKSASMSWTLPSGVSLSYFRITDDTLGTNPPYWIPENVSDTGPSITMPTIPGHAYHYWVHGRLPDGNNGPSIGGSFTCNSTSNLTISSPGAISGTYTTGTLSGAGTYAVDYNGSANIIVGGWAGYTASATGCTSTSGGGYQANLTCTISGMISAKTVTVTYTNTPPPMSTPIYPANGSTVNNGGAITFTTNAVTDAEGQTVQYYFRVATGTDAETGQVCNSGWITSTSYTCNPGVGTLYWHVYTYDGIAQTNPNYVWSFYNNAQPSGVSVSPSSGTYKGAQTFTSVYRDPNGGSTINYHPLNTPPDVGYVHLLINTGVDGNNTAFYGYYQPTTATTGNCYIYGSDTNYAWNAAPYTQPNVTLNSCSHSYSGTDMTVTWNLTFGNWNESNMGEYLYAVDNKGWSWGWSQMGTISVTPVAPAAPTGLWAGPDATCNVSNIYLSWNASPTATSYQLYRGGTLIYNGPALLYTDTGLSLATQYSYTVYATNAGGQSVVSNTVSAKVANACAPTPDIKVTTNYTTNSDGPTETYVGNGITLSWAAVANAASCTFGGGTISPVSVGVSAGSGPTTASAFTQTYTLDCVNSTGQHGSDSVTIITPPLPLTYTQTCNAAATVATLNWTLPAGYTGGYVRPSAPFYVTTVSGLTQDISIVPRQVYNTYLQTKASNGAWSNPLYLNNINPGSFSCIPPVYTLTVSKVGTGTGTVTGAGSYDNGKTATATAAADAGSFFVGWSGSCSGTANNSVLMDSNKTCTATFTKIPVVNTVTVNPNPVSIGSNTTISYTASYASYCYVLIDWDWNYYNVTDTSSSNTGSYLVTPPKTNELGDHTASVLCKNDTVPVPDVWTSVPFVVSPNRPTVITTNPVPFATITSNTAIDGGTIVSNGGALVTQAGLVWSTNPNPTTDINSGITYDGWAIGGPWTSTMSSLTFNTTYHVRAYAINSAGTSYGADVTFTTGGVPPSVTTIGTMGVTTTTAQGRGSVTATGGATVFERGSVWSTTLNPTILNNKSASGSGLGSFTSNLNGLTYHTLYYIRAYAINSVGISYGANMSFTTLALAPTVTTSSPVSLGQNSGRSGGTIVSDGGVIITTSGIVWSTNPNPVYPSANQKTDGWASGSWTSADMTGLTVGTTYHVRAFAVNSVGKAYGADLTFTTYPPVPPTVITTDPVPTATIKTDTAIGGGTTSADGGALVTQAGLVWSTNLNPTTASNSGITYDGWALGGPWTSTMTGLTYDTDYHVRAYAINSAGTSYGADVTFRTQPVLSTANIHAIDCRISSGSNVCNTTLNWDTINPIDGFTSIISLAGVTVTTGNSMAVNPGYSKSIYYGNNVFSISHAGKTLSSVTASAICSQIPTATYWDGSICHPTAVSCAENQIISTGGTCIDCTPPLVADPNTNTCVVQQVCTSPKVLVKFDNSCQDKNLCVSPQVYVTYTNKCETKIDCTDPLKPIRDIYTNTCITAADCNPPKTVKPNNTCSSSSTFIYTEN